MISIIIAILLIISLANHIARKSTSPNLKWIRYICWHLWMRKRLIRIAVEHNPILGYMIFMYVVLNPAAKKSYVDGGIVAFVAGIGQNYSFKPPKRTKQRSIDFMRRWKREQALDGTTADEEEYINKFLKQESNAT